MLKCTLSQGGNTLTIGDVARRAGLNASAIRYYESAGLLPAPPRRDGRRVYDESVLDRLVFIQAARRMGFAVKEIAVLEAAGPRRRFSKLMRDTATRKLEELDGWIERAQRMRAVLVASLGCDCLDVTMCGRNLRDARVPAPPGPSQRIERADER